MKIRPAVQRVPAADSAIAQAHFEHRLTVETDCWDVHDSMKRTERDFVLVDVRSPELFEAEHLPGAVSIAHPTINRQRLAGYPDETLFVVYCAGPHCNGATKAALRLARLGRPVKEMVGGIEGWRDEGFSFQTGNAAGKIDATPAAETLGAEALSPV